MIVSFRLIARMRRPLRVSVFEWKSSPRRARPFSATTCFPFFQQMGGKASVEALQIAAAGAFGEDAVYGNCHGDHFSFHEVLAFLASRGKLERRGDEVLLGLRARLLRPLIFPGSSPRSFFSHREDATTAKWQTAAAMTRRGRLVVPEDPRERVGPLHRVDDGAEAVDDSAGREEDDRAGAEGRLERRQERHRSPAEEDADGRDEHLRRPDPRHREDDPGERPGPDDGQEHPAGPAAEEERERRVRPGDEQEDRGVVDAPRHGAHLLGPVRAGGRAALTAKSATREIPYTIAPKRARGVAARKTRIAPAAAATNAATSWRTPRRRGFGRDFVLGFRLVPPSAPQPTPSSSGSARPRGR